VSIRLKVIIIGIFLLFSNLYCAGMQIQLNNGMWQAIGIQGAYTADITDVGYDADSSFEFYDVADSNTTWMTLNTSTSQLAYNTVSGVSNVYGPTTQLSGVIGLFVIKGQRSKKKSNFTILDGTTTNVVKMKVLDSLPYRGDIPMYRMYVEGQSGVAAFRIDFQSDYQGKSFKLRFGKEPEAYIGYFNYENTFTNPAKISLDTQGGANVGSSVNVVDAIDFNMTDNNVTALTTTNLFKVKDRSGAYNSVFRPYSADAGNRIEAYSMSDGATWKRFDTANSLSSSNSFTKFEGGKGYWVRASSKQSHADGNKTMIGLLSSDTVRIDENKIYGNLENGWHMLTFEESDLRYAQSGIFINEDMYKTSTSPHLTIFFNRHASSKTDTNITRANYIKTNSTVNPNATTNISNGVIARTINLASTASNLLFGESTKMRAFPAIEANGATTAGGVIVLSDSLFEVNSSNTTTIKTLAGSNLQSTSRGFYSSKFGEFMLAFRLTDINNSEINGTMGISMPKINPNEEKIGDFNASSINTVLASIKDAFSKTATKPGDSTPTTLSNVYSISLDFNSSAYPSTSYNRIAYPHILMAAGARFSITDRTYTRLYSFKQNGKFKVVGALGSREISPSVLDDDNITRTIDAINAVSNDTGVVATDLGENKSIKYFMITSSAGAVSLEEDYNATLFTDLPLGSSSIPESSVKLTKGAISEVYSVRDILDRELVYDLSLMDVSSNTTVSEGNLSWEHIKDYSFADSNGTPDTTIVSPKLTKDLTSNAVWVPDFPIKLSLIQKFAKYGKEIINISVQRFSHDNISYYDFLDLTKDPSDWYGNTYNTSEKSKFNNDFQGIFHIYPNTNYWIRLKDKVTIPAVTKAMSSTSSIVYTAKPSFNNKVTKGISVTQNHIKHSLNIKFDSSFINPLARDYYNVVAIIGGIKYYLRDNGSYFTLNIDDMDMNLVAKDPSQADDAIFINAYDGAGNILKEEGTKKSKFSIYFRKPPVPEISFDATSGQIVVANKKGYIVEKYTSFISDIASKRNNSMVKELNSSKFGWKASGDKDTYGQVIPLRVVLKDAKYPLYSDIKTILYAPLYEGHILKVTSKDKVARVPYSFSQKQMLTNQDAGSTSFAKYNGINGVDNGVQLSMQEGASNKDVSLYYYPEGAESQRRITQFGGTRTMYISLKEDKSTDSKAIASITYLPSYENKIFYLYFNNNLYQGRFQGNDNFNNDSSTYNMSDTTLSIDKTINTTNAAQTLATDTHGNKIELGSTNPQAIVIPKMSATTPAAKPAITPAAKPATKPAALPAKTPPASPIPTP